MNVKIRRITGMGCPRSTPPVRGQWNRTSGYLFLGWKYLERKRGEISPLRMRMAGKYRKRTHGMA